MGVGWGGFDINNGLLTFIDAKYEDWDATISSCPIHHNRCIYYRSNSGLHIHKVEFLTTFFGVIHSKKSRNP